MSRVRRVHFVYSVEIKESHQLQQRTVLHHLFRCYEVFITANKVISQWNSVSLAPVAPIWKLCQLWLSGRHPTANQRLKLVLMEIFDSRKVNNNLRRWLPKCRFNWGAYLWHLQWETVSWDVHVENWSRSPRKQVSFEQCSGRSNCVSKAKLVE